MSEPTPKPDEPLRLDAGAAFTIPDAHLMEGARRTEARKERKPLPSLGAIKPDTPLRLAVAAALAFPDGSMTESGLRKACSNSDESRRLGHERLRGKIYTTLAAIEDWRAWA